MNQLLLSLLMNSLQVCTFKHFKLHLIDERELFLSFSVEAISAVTINGQFINDETVYQNHRLYLYPKFLKLNEWNIVKVKYIQAYSTNRIGLHSYVENEAR